MNKERLNMVEALSKVRKRYQDIYDEVVETSDEIEALSKALGISSDSSTSKSGLADVAKEHLVYLKKRLLDLQLERIQLTNETEEGEEGIKAAELLDSKIGYVVDRIDSGVRGPDPKAIP